jgi:hypothetical protein
MIPEMYGMETTKLPVTKIRLPAKAERSTFGKIIGAGQDVRV